MAEQSKNYLYSTNLQVVIDADSRLIVTVGRPLPGNRNDCRTWELSGAKAAVGNTTVIAGGGYRGTGLVISYCREPGQGELPTWKEELNRSHRKVRARVEHTFTRMTSWKILRDCRLKGNGVHHAMLGTARLHNPIPPDSQRTRGAAVFTMLRRALRDRTQLACDLERQVEARRTS